MRATKYINARLLYGCETGWYALIAGFSKVAHFEPFEPVVAQVAQVLPADAGMVPTHSVDSVLHTW